MLPLVCGKLHWLQKYQIQYMGTGVQDSRRKLTLRSIALLCLIFGVTQGLFYRVHFSVGLRYGFWRIKFEAACCIELDISILFKLNKNRSAQSTIESSTDFDGLFSRF